MPGRPCLVLACETEAACRDRLTAEGFAAPHAAGIATYLAQSTDLAADFAAIETACADRGLGFLPVGIDGLPLMLDRLDRAGTLLWPLTDGIAYFNGSAVPAIARLAGLRCIGAEAATFALCQDKFRSGAVLRALALPAPAAGLLENGTWLVPPPTSASGWFVKPNRLGAKIGIWEDSHVHDPAAAEALSVRIHEAYRDRAIVQPYVPGRNVRASFLAVDPAAGTERLGIDLVDSGGDFQTMADSMSLYGETGGMARTAADVALPTLVALDDLQPRAAEAIREIAARLMRGLAIRDVFSMDLRMTEEGEIHLIEFEVCPGLPCFDFRDYCRRVWGIELPAALAGTAATRLLRHESGRGR